MRRALALMLCVVSAGGCSDDETTSAPPDAVFAADWESVYEEVRDCRRSADHDLRYVRIFVDDVARASYVDRDTPFPDGSVVFKAEYTDPACGGLESLTAMRREAGLDPDRGDWHWQRASADGVVERDGRLEDCLTCHAACGVPPDGFDGTCAAP